MLEKAKRNPVRASAVIAIALLFIFLKSSQAVAQDTSLGNVLPASELSALDDLYQLLGGTGWDNQTGWMDPTQSIWYGITVAGETFDTNGNLISPGHVVCIYLVANELTGTLPASIGNFPQLQALVLNGNTLSGSIPTVIGNLLQLQVLDLSYNQFTGSIPSQIGNLTTLQYLNLSGNQLAGTIPTSIGQLTQLQTCYLTSNQLTGAIPTQITNLTLLQELRLGSTAIP